MAKKIFAALGEEAYNRIFKKAANEVASIGTNADEFLEALKLMSSDVPTGNPWGFLNKAIPEALELQKGGTIRAARASSFPDVQETAESLLHRLSGGAPEGMSALGAGTPAPRVQNVGPHQIIRERTRELPNFNDTINPNIIASARKNAVPAHYRRHAEKNSTQILTGIEREIDRLLKQGPISDEAFKNLKVNMNTRLRGDSMTRLGSGALQERIMGASSMGELRDVARGLRDPSSGFKEAYVQTSGMGRHAVGDFIYANKLPQWGAGIGGTAWLVSNLSDRKGRMSNAELYNQR